MKAFKIKVLRDTPSHLAGSLMEPMEFKLFFPYIVHPDKFDKRIYDILFEQKELSKWFETIEVQHKFKLGDWVFNEKTQCAYKIVDWCYGVIELLPNQCTLAAVEENPSVYKRLATHQEIAHFELHSFKEGKILIGKHKCYYTAHIFQEIKGIEKIVKEYCFVKKEFFIEVLTDVKPKQLSSVFYGESNGLRFGCMEFTHAEIKEVARILEITP